MEILVIHFQDSLYTDKVDQAKVDHYSINVELFQWQFQTEESKTGQRYINIAINDRYVLLLWFCKRE